MGAGIFGSKDQAAFSQGMAWGAQGNNKKEGVGVAIAGLAAAVQAKKRAAGFEALYNTMLDILTETNPNHPMVVNREMRLEIFNKAYDKA